MIYKPYNLQDVYDASEQNKFKVISTFAGGGGSSTGYRLAGGKVLVIKQPISVNLEMMNKFYCVYANPLYVHSYFLIASPQIFHAYRSYS